MNVVSIVFLSLFVFASVIHLYFCWTEKEKARKISKPFTISLLSVSIIFLVPSHPLIWLFPLLSFVGDFFLIFKKKSMAFFVLGFVFFFLGHVCNLIELTILLFKSDTTIPVIAYIVFAVALTLVIIFVFPITRKIAGRISLLANVYMPTLLFVGAFSLLCTAAYANCYQGLLIALGYVFFIFSDAFLLYANFLKDVKRHDFYVMSTYLIGELLICVGFSLLMMMGVVS